MNNQEASVAIYWDFENVHASAMRIVHGDDWFQRQKAKKINIRQTKVLDIAAIMQYASTLGEVVVNKAYADWSDFWPYRELLSGYSIDCAQLFPIGMHAKNGADIRLSLDIVEDIVAYPHIDIVLLVSGDSDFIAVAQRVRRSNKRIIGLGVQKSSNRYWQMACNEFKFYHTVVAQHGAAGEQEAEDVASALAEDNGAERRERRGRSGSGRGGKRGGRSVRSRSESSNGSAASAKTSTSAPDASGEDDDYNDDDEIAFVLVESPEEAALFTDRSADDTAGNASDTERPASNRDLSPADAQDGDEDDEDEIAYVLAEDDGPYEDEDRALDNDAEPVVGDADGDDRDGGEAVDGGAAAGIEAPEVPKRFTAVSPEKRLLVQALQSMEAREGKPWIQRVKVKPMMLRLDPAFDEANHDYPNFTEFLEGNDDIVELKETEDDMLVRVKPGRRGRGARTGPTLLVGQAAT